MLVVGVALSVKERLQLPVRALVAVSATTSPSTSQYQFELRHSQLDASAAQHSLSVESKRTSFADTTICARGSYSFAASQLPQLLLGWDESICRNSSEPQ
jgi:hypothetical protein